MNAPTLFDFGDLVERIRFAALTKKKKIVFLVGAPLSSAPNAASSGVYSVDQMIEQIRNEFAQDPVIAAKFEQNLTTASDRAYQSAFAFLNGLRGQDTANALIQRAVLNARRSGPVTELNVNLRHLDEDLDGWALSPGASALGALIHRMPAIFGQAVLTTNFDPLVEVAISKSGGTFYRTVLHDDGNLEQTSGSGCHVVHLHGYWHGSDTLHTPLQLTQPRPKLKASLRNLICDSLVVVVAYGGWDDVFLAALSEVVSDSQAYPEVIWAFYSDSDQDIQARNSHLWTSLQGGIDRGRVTLFKGIDCHDLFPHLLTLLAPDPCEVVEEAPVEIIGAIQLTEGERILAAAFDKPRSSIQPEPDSLPNVDVWCGRDSELKRMTERHHAVVSISGIGGQGKSSLASYLVHKQAVDTKQFDFWDWRDCREEANRIHSATASLIHRLATDVIDPANLSSAPLESLVDKLFEVLGRRKAIIVFDNVDNYVDLESGAPLRGLDVLYEAALARDHQSTFVFTSRPRIQTYNPRHLLVTLEGLDEDESRELFKEHSSGHDLDEMQLAKLYSTTNGHPLWISLIAAQSARQDGGLEAVLADISQGRGDLPANTLLSIWNRLNENQRRVLRVLAELEQPETEASLEELIPDINWNRLSKALKNLRGQNLIAVRRRPDGPDLVDLHPLIRQYIRTEFPKQDRDTFIVKVIAFLDKKLARYRKQIPNSLPTSVLEWWIHRIDLTINQGNLAEAVDVLVSVHGQLEAQGKAEQTVRLSKRIRGALDFQVGITSFKSFDRFFDLVVRTLMQFNETVEADSWIDSYQKAIPGMGAQFINLCDVLCYRHWFAGDFEQAVHWGEKGEKLLQSTSVDTPFSTKSNLALARRDCGRIDEALETFLAGESLEEVTEIATIDSNRDGAFYGNIGRCLDFSGRLELALICYRKSARILENKTKEFPTNRGYIRYWVAQAMHTLGRDEDAYMFFRAAIDTWNGVAPLRAEKVKEELSELLAKNPDLHKIELLAPWRFENRFVQWVNEVTFKETTAAKKR